MARVVSPTRPSLDREPLRPVWSITPWRVVDPHPRAAFPAPHRYDALMRQTSPRSRPTHSGLGRKSVQVAACPCWDEGLPDVLSPSCVQGRGPVPRRASAGRLPVSARRTSAAPSVQPVRRAATPAMRATAMTHQLRGCSHSVMFRRPHLRGPQGAPTVEAPSLRGRRAVYATQRTCGYPSRTVVARRA